MDSVAMTQSKRDIRLVVAVCLLKGGRVLTAQRNENDEDGLKWEFPGGTIAGSETPAQALRREIREELGLEISAGSLFHTGRSLKRRIEVRYFFGRIRRGSPKAVGCRAWKWVTAEELGGLDLAALDRKAAARLAKMISQKEREKP
jgi:8-oxo-dGTP diphosphatase